MAGEEITEFYERALSMSNEIDLQEDKTGQANKLTHRFVLILSEFIDILPCLRQVKKELALFFRSKDHHLLTFPRSIREIYEEDIELEDIPTLLLFSNKISQRLPSTNNLHDPKINASRFNRKELDKSQSQNCQRDNRQEHKQRRTPASNIPCPACSFSNRDLHRMLASIHLPKRPN